MKTFSLLCSSFNHENQSCTDYPSSLYSNVAKVDDVLIMFKNANTGFSTLVCAKIKQIQVVLSNSSNNNIDSEYYYFLTSFSECL